MPPQFPECWVLSLHSDGSLSSTLSFSCLDIRPSLQAQAPYVSPLPSEALLFIPKCSPQIPKRPSRPETLASSSSLSYFFLLCVQVIITAPSPPSAFLEVCRPFSLSPLPQPKPWRRHTSLPTRRPSHSSVSTSGPWKFPPCSPGPHSLGHLLQSLASAVPIAVPSFCPTFQVLLMPPCPVTVGT